MMGVKQFPEFRSERLLDYLSTAVMVLDDHFRLMYLNPAGEVLLATSASHARGKAIRELIINADMLTEHLSAAMENGYVINQRNCRLELPDLHSLIVNCTHTPITLPGQRNGTMLELRKVEHHLRIAQEEQLITQQEATHALLRGLAHEIKNPLGGLRGAAQLLEQEIADAALKEYTRIIIGEADRLQNLMDRMLGPNDIPNMRGTNIHTILERVRELVRVEADSGLRIHQDYDPSLPELHADPDMLVQAILNIVRNAAQALEGEGEIVLRTRVQRQFNIGNRLHRLVACIQVIDNGPGIDEQLREKIFFPMITTRSDGTGLGLSIAQSLISRHQGLIECSSKPGETVFTILMPLDSKNES
ncbi:MAG: nitrogen regulation protein NR(II) [Gammaproteobacteria bacterium]|nr:nitrogen regulation protein NR(II) [Gammaproteobacteria bacterium]MDH3561540.1 nitrogen regulation protein NR(II) [Gammaproteobacteria bacterium]